MCYGRCPYQRWDGECGHSSYYSQFSDAHCHEDEELQDEDEELEEEEEPEE